MSQQTGARGQLETLLVRRTPLRVYNPRTRPYTLGVHIERHRTGSIQWRSRYVSIMHDLLDRDKPFARFPANKSRDDRLTRVQFFCSLFEIEDSTRSRSTSLIVSFYAYIVLVADSTGPFFPHRSRSLVRIPSPFHRSFISVRQGDGNTRRRRTQVGSKVNFEARCHGVNGSPLS